MITTYKNDGSPVDIPKFNTLDKIVLSNSGSTTKTLYYGSDKEILDLGDINEYNWKFIIKKLNYNTDFILGNLFESTKKDIVGGKKEDIEKVATTFFPTALYNQQGTTDSVGYFGSITIGKQRLIMFNIPAEYSKVDIYDTSISSSNSIINIDFSKNKNSGGEIVDTNEGTIYYKLVWFVITAGDENMVSDINLSYYSWKDNINPFRNMNKYLVRRDEASKPVSKLSTIEDILDGFSGSEQILVDGCSGTLVGNKETGSPILTQISNKYFKDQTWDRHVLYRQGSVVEWGGYNWICLEDIEGEEPMYSKYWVVSDTINPNRYKRLRVFSYVEDDLDKTIVPGYIFPGVITRDVGLMKDFNITYKYGYVLSQEYSDNDDYLVDSGADHYITKEMIDFNCYRNGSRTLYLHVMVYEDQESVEIKFYKYFSQLEIVDLEGSDITHNYNICDVGLSVESGTTGPGEYLLSIGSEFTLSLSPTSGATDVGTFRSIRRDLVVNSAVIESENLLGSDIVTKTGGQLFIKDKVKYPATYRYVVDLVKLFMVSVIEYIGFIVNNSELVVKKDSGYIGATYNNQIQLFPIGGSDTGVNIEIISEGITIGTINMQVGSLISSTLTSGDTIFTLDPMGTNNYYGLSVDNINANYTIKVWK
jgi:hypothetical protein